MNNPYAVTAVEHHRAGLEMLDEAYRLLGTPTRDAAEADGVDDEVIELSALVRAQIARAHFAAAGAMTSGLAGPQWAEWQTLAQQTRTPETEAAVRAAFAAGEADAVPPADVDEALGRLLTDVKRTGEGGAAAL